MRSTHVFLKLWYRLLRHGVVEQMVLWVCPVVDHTDVVQPRDRRDRLPSSDSLQSTQRGCQSVAELFRRRD